MESGIALQTGGKRDANLGSDILKEAPMFRRILVPLDGTRYGDHALPYAVAVARETGAAVELAHVHHHVELDSDLAALPQYQFQRIAEADHRNDLASIEHERAELEERAADLELRYGIDARTRILTGRTADALSREAREIVADLVVMATHAREGIDRIRFGDVAHELIEQLNVPALCIRPESEDEALAAPRMRRFLVPLDGSEFSEQILDVAAPLMLALRATPTLLNVVGARPLFGTGIELAARNGFATREEGLDYLNGVAARFRGRMPEPVLTVIDAIDTPTSIAQLLDTGGFDIVAMATHGRSGLSRLLLGSVAERVLRRTHRPVLIYRPRADRLPPSLLEEAIRFGE